MSSKKSKVKAKKKEDDKKSTKVTKAKVSKKSNASNPTIELSTIDSQQSINIVSKKSDNIVQKNDIPAPVYRGEVLTPNYDTKDRRITPTSQISTISIPSIGIYEYKQCSVPKSVTNISKIIADSPPGSEIILNSGSFNEDLVIDKPIKIISKGDVSLVSSGRAHTITIQSDNVYIQGIKIIQSSLSFNSICILSGSLTLSNCTVISLYSDALCAKNQSISHVKGSTCISKTGFCLVASDSCSVLCEKCDFRDSKGSGVLLNNKSQSKFVECTIRTHDQNGLIVIGDAKIDFDKCSVLGCGRNGIEIGILTDHVFFHECNVNGCGNCGFVVYRLSSVSIVDCEISQCGSCAIECRDGCGVLLNGNTFYDCCGAALLLLWTNSSVDSSNDSYSQASGSAIYANDSSEINISHAQIDNICQFGVVCNNHSIVSVSNTTITNIQKSGLVSYGYSQLRVNHCSLSNIFGNGVCFRNSVEASIEHTQIEKCQLFGIEMVSLINSKIEYCTISNNSKCGIVCLDSLINIGFSEFCKNKFSGCELRNSKVICSQSSFNENTLAGISAKGKSNATLQKCVLSKNGFCGINLESEALLLCNEGEILQNGQIGVSTTSKSKSDLKHTQINQNKKYGVYVCESTSSLANCTISDNQIGILGLVRSNLDIIESTFLNNNQHIDIREETIQTISNSSFTNSTGKCGILSSHLSTTSMDSCTINDSKQYGFISQSSKSAIISNCCFTNGKDIAVLIRNTPSSTIIKNTIENNGSVGLYIDAKTKASISSNSFSSHQIAGVFLEDLAEKSLIDNSFEDSGISSLFIP